MKTPCSQEEMLALAAKAMKISWPQHGVNEHARRWNPAENDSDCLHVIFTLKLSIDPMGFDSLAEMRQSVLLRAAYLGLHT